VKRDRRTVDADEALPSSRTKKAGLLFASIHVEIAVSEEDHGVEGVQILRLHLSGFL